MPDDVLLPCRWLREEVGEGRMEFRRDDGRFALSVVRRGECPALPDRCPGRGWELRCHRRAGEATSTTTLGCVTTRDLALDTVLSYMERLNEAIEGEIGVAPGAMVDLLAEDPAGVDHGDWEREPTERIDVGTLSP